MAAENALQPDPHRDGAKNPAEQLADVPLYAPASVHKNRQQQQRPAMVVTTERTPLVLKIDTSWRSTQSAEEVHPLPWFRSPEWGRKSPQLGANGRRGSGQQQKRRRGRGSADDSSSSATTRWWCFGRGNAAASERDVEIGVYGGRSRAVGAADDADGFRQCIQFLVALILVVAIALIFMIVFQPFHESSTAAGEW